MEPLILKLEFSARYPKCSIQLHSGPADIYSSQLFIKQTLFNGVPSCKQHSRIAVLQPTKPSAGISLLQPLILHSPTSGRNNRPRRICWYSWLYRLAAIRIMMFWFQTSNMKHWTQPLPGSWVSAVLCVRALLPFPLGAGRAGINIYNP